MKPVILQLVTWNGAKYLPHLFQSLREQVFVDWELVILDNASTDNTVALLEKELATVAQPWQLIKNTKNLGFAGGHNQLFATTLADDARYILLVNQDTLWDKFFLDCLFYFLEMHPDAGAVSGRLLRWDFPTPTKFIDTLGLKGKSNHRVVENHGGERWREECEDVKAVEVFGVSGALPLFRIAALRDLAPNYQVFDTDFISYKEDVDLAWSLRLLGWHAFTVLDAIAYHDRGSGRATTSDWAAAAVRGHRSALINFYSYRNHLLMLIKHLGVEGRIDGPTLWYEIKKAIFLFFCEPKTFWRAWWQVLKLLPRFWRKRQDLILRRRATDWEMRQWFK